MGIVSIVVLVISKILHASSTVHAASSASVHGVNKVIIKKKIIKKYSYMCIVMIIISMYSVSKK